MINEIEPLIHVITGPMYSAKTSAMISHVKDHKYAGCKFQFFKPTKDNRYSENRIITNNGELSVPATNIQDSKDLETKLNLSTEVIGIDEIQFFDSDIIKLLINLRKEKKQIYVACLDKYHNMLPTPFIDNKKNIGELLAIADIIEKKTAYCQEKINDEICGATARYTKKIKGNKNQLVEVGGKEMYIATCLDHHDY